MSFITFQYVFKGVGDNSFYQNVIAALIGTLLTIIITSFLLRQQAKSEELKEQNVGVFNKKCELYEEVTNLLIDVMEDGKIDPAEAIQIKRSIYKLSLFCSPKSLNVVGDFLRYQTIGDTSKKIGILEVTSVLREDLQLEGVEEFDQDTLRSMENLIEDGFELVPVLQNINHFFSRINEEFTKKVDYDIIDRDLFEIADPSGTSNNVSFTINSDYSNYLFRCNYPKTINQDRQILVFDVGSNNNLSNSEVLCVYLKITNSILIDKNIKRFVDVLESLNFEVSGWDEENEIEDFEQYDDGAVGFKSYRIDYEIDNGNIVIKSSPSRIAAQLINDVTAIETLFTNEEK